MQAPTRAKLPRVAVLEMTYRCNHACLFCSSPWMSRDGSFSEAGELSTTAWCETIDALLEGGVRALCFTGGEALLRSDLWEIVAHAASMTNAARAPSLYLLSNGALVDDRVVALCRRFAVQLSVSLPGLRTYGRLTDGGDPDAALAALSRAKAHGLKTVVAITVTRVNLFELFETIAAGFLAGATHLHLNRFLVGGRGKEHAAELALGLAELHQMLDTAESALGDARRFGSVGTELPTCLFEPARYHRLRVSTGCSAAREFFVVGPSGRIRVCNHSPRELVHWAQLDQLADEPYWQIFARQDYLPKACAPCKDLGACVGGCREMAHIVSGDVNGLDPLVTPPEG